MPSARVAAAHARDAAQRHRDYDEPVKIGATTAAGIYNSARWARYLREGGFVSEHDSHVLLLKSAWPAFNSRQDFKEKVVELFLNNVWVKFSIGSDAVTDLHRSGEWKMDLHTGVA